MAMEINQIGSLKKQVLLVFSFFAFVYLATINQCQTLVIDSANYLENAIAGPASFHPHHLLYHVLLKYWAKMLMGLGIENIFYATSSVNALFGAGALSVVFMTFRKRFCIDLRASLLFLAPVAFSFGFWIVSTSVNVYTIPAFFTLLMFYLYLDPEESKKKWIAIGLSHACAIIFNQWNVLIFVAVTAAVIISKDRKLLLRKYYPLYAIFSGFGTIFVYLLVMTVFLNIYSYSSMLEWISYYASLFPTTSSPFQIAKEWLIGMGQTITAPYWIFSNERISSFIYSIMRADMSFEEEIFIYRNLPSGLFYLYTILFTGVVSLIVANLISLLKNIKSVLSNARTPFFYITFWIVSVSIMPLFWSGYNQRYWFMQTTLIYVLLGLCSKIQSKIGNRSPKKMFVALGATLLVLNLFSIFIYSTDLENDLTYRKSLAVASAAQKGDIAIGYETWNMFAYYHLFFNQVKFIPLGDPEHSMNSAVAEWKDLESQPEAHRLFIYRKSFDSEDGELKANKDRIRNLMSKPAIRIDTVANEFADYYVIQSRSK